MHTIGTIVFLLLFYDISIFGQPVRVTGIDGTPALLLHVLADGRRNTFSQMDAGRRRREVVGDDRRNVPEIR